MCICACKGHVHLWECAPVWACAPVDSAGGPLRLLCVSPPPASTKMGATSPQSTVSSAHLAQQPGFLGVPFYELRIHAIPCFTSHVAQSRHTFIIPVTCLRFLLAL